MDIDINKIILTLKENKIINNLYFQEENLAEYIIFDIGNYNIKFCHVSLKDKINIKDFQVLRIDFEKTDDYITGLEHIIKDLLYGRDFSQTKVIVLFSGQKVTNRFIEIPKIPEDEVTIAVRFEVKKLLHIEPEKLIINHRILKTFKDDKGKEKIKIFVGIIKKQDVLTVEDIFKKNGLPISVITIDSEFYSMGYENLEFSDERVAFIDIGAENTNFNIVCENIFEFSRNIPMGGNALTELIAKDISGSPAKYRDFLNQAEVSKKTSILFLNEEDAEKLEENDKIVALSLADGVSRIIQRIRLTLGYFKTQVKGKNIDKIYISGGTSNIKNIEKFFSENLGLETYLIPEFKNELIEFEDEIIKNRFKENRNYTFIIENLAISLFKEKEVLNYIFKENKEGLTIDNVIDVFPEPQKIFTISGIMLFLYLIYNSVLFSIHSTDKINMYSDLRKQVNKYKEVEDNIKWDLSVENRNIKNINTWMDEFKSYDKNWFDFIYDFTENLPENAYAQKFEVESLKKYDVIKYKIAFVIEFEGVENYKRFKFMLEGPSVWGNQFKLEKVLIKERPKVNKRGKEFYIMDVEAILG